MLFRSGSLLGCLALYAVGRKGGDAFIRKRFGTGSVDRTLKAIKRNGVLAILVPALLPPPAPFKIFVLLAGLAGISPGRFTIAIIIGRGIRYFGEGLLALYYGERAVGFIKENSGTVGLWLVGLILVGAGVWWLWQRRRATATPSA